MLVERTRGQGGKQHTFRGPGAGRGGAGQADAASARDLLRTHLQASLNSSKGNSWVPLQNVHEGPGGSDSSIREGGHSGRLQVRKDNLAERKS